MLIADTGPLVAMLNAKDRHHEACTALFRRFRGPIVVPAPIVTEVAYFLQIEPGPAVARVATIDHRHFRAVRPAHCAAFELLPAL
jgi:predicted nucleic acid-binding protein